MDTGISRCVLAGLREEEEGSRLTGHEMSGIEVSKLSLTGSMAIQVPTLLEPRRKARPTVGQVESSAKHSRGYVRPKKKG
jgi:hypothetical protein